MYLTASVALSALFGSLLVKVSLDAALGSLASIVLCLSLDLLVAVASQTSNNPTNRAGDAVRDALAQVAELTLSFLGLALLILVDSLLLEALCANEVANHLLSRADSLVPGTFLTVWVVLGDA